jgi:uncharacterized C2H2 Zn-finger protein
MSYVMNVMKVCLRCPDCDSIFHELDFKEREESQINNFDNENFNKYLKRLK